MFAKYKGSSCPRMHLAMYCRKMASYIHQEKILVHCFQDSLTGAALSWVQGLRSKVAVGSVASSFTDLVTIGERIESGIKRGNFAQTNSSIGFVRKPSQERRKGEANTVILDPFNLYGQGKIPYTPQIILNKLGTSV
ncbi:hypothetical protein CR513_41391, partial [Mucuna pruriens]